MQSFYRFGIAHFAAITMSSCAVVLTLCGTASAQALFAPEAVLDTPFFLQGPGAGPVTVAIGRTVDISGDMAVVVVREDFAMGYLFDVAYLFERDAASNTWHLLKELLGSHFDPMSGLGCCITDVALSGNTAVVSLGRYTSVFDRNRGGADAWGEVTTLAVPDKGYVFDVAISGNTVAVAAADFAVSTPGVVHLFERNHGGVSAWGHTATLPGITVPRLFRSAVALSGNTLLVGVVEGAGNLQQVHVFERNRGGTNAWGFLKRLPYLPPALPHAAPPVVAIDGDTAVAGSNSGPYVFERHRGGTNAWGLVPPAGPRDAFYASSVDISGNIIVTSGQLPDPTLAGRDTIRTYARHQNGANAWGAIASPIVPDPPPTPYPFPEPPWSLNPAVSGDTIVVGAPRSPYWASVPTSSYPFGAGIGAAFVFGSDIDRDGDRDALDPCPRDPLNNVAGRCRRAIGVSPVVDHLMTLATMTYASVGSDMIITASFKNTSQTTIRNPFLTVAELSGGNLLKNADGGPGGVGATLSPDVGDGVLEPGESMTVRLVIQLASRNPFRFFVHVQGDV
jgi:hypothetical protein